MSGRCVAPSSSWLLCSLSAARALSLSFGFFLCSFFVRISPRSARPLAPFVSLKIRISPNQTYLSVLSIIMCSPYPHTMETLHNLMRRSASTPGPCHYSPQLLPEPSRPGKVYHKRHLPDRFQEYGSIHAHTRSLLKQTEGYRYVLTDQERKMIAKERQQQVPLDAYNAVSFVWLQRLSLPVPLSA